MDITINARNAEIHPDFRAYVEEKVQKVQLFDPRVQRVEVELTHERNPRQADTAERVEITVISKGPIIRAEASSSDRYAALDIAAGKLAERLRRAHDRSKDHHRLAPPSLAPTAEELKLGTPLPEEPAPAPVAEEEAPASRLPALGETVETQLGDSPVIVRQKLHEATRLTVDEALYQMELVGHPFYIFIDAETDQPCAVYHRHGWTYGVIRLDAKVC
ncbi:ribosome-associated translation inhibitor RaiA [Buchananella felis]|uniref:ribosome hibernation-promoting factor, HPF/YfiA family n=1 Tax=Buchananella felis TaxID=3231492 RepID=UPI00352910C9